GLSARPEHSGSPSVIALSSSAVPRAVLVAIIIGRHDPGVGEDVRRPEKALGYGNRGSLAVDIKKGTWFDHEANIGGGVLDLIRRQGHEQPAAWLRATSRIGSPLAAAKTGGS